jgi:hypothetical protein
MRRLFCSRFIHPNNRIIFIFHQRNVHS